MSNPNLSAPRRLEPISGDRTFPDALRDAEWPTTRGTPRLGVGLSGGGIRSATFSLGFFQGLAQCGLLRHIDYLSTVSGGGYFGAFYGHLLHRKQEAAEVAARKAAEAGGVAPNVEPDPVADAEKELADPASPSVRFLRENGRYLSPNGAGDLLLGAAISIRNWAAVMLVLGSLALFLLTLMVLSRSGMSRLPRADELPAVVVGPVSMSPFFWVALLMLVVLAVPPAVAYWMVPTQRRPSRPVRMLVGIAGGGVLLVVIGVASIRLDPPWALASVLGTLTLLTLANYVAAMHLASRSARHLPADDPEPRPGAETRSMPRNTLSRWLTRAFLTIGIVLVLALVDTIGAFLLAIQQGTVTVTVYAALGVAIGWGRRRVAALSTRLGTHDRPSLPITLLVDVGAVVLVLALLGGIAVIPHAVAAAPDGGDWLVWLAAGSLALLIALGGLWPFVNRSSLHAVYEARLRRAYLGATNPVRLKEGEDFPPVTEPDPGDGLPLAGYNPASIGGPVHLINVTVNETVDGRSQLEQRDRKGRPLAVGPGGLSLSRTHHATWGEPVPRQGIVAQVTAAFTAEHQTPVKPGRFRVFPKATTSENLDVGQWVAISGAAFSTGLGSRTSLGFSLLAGLLNVRLGYWWGSGVMPKDRGGRPKRTWAVRAVDVLRWFCPVQFALLDEWFARFPGVARQEWYLSDGGHFENLGGYELIRRRLPFIVVCDNEQDPDYDFPGLGNLVRKARTDFRTEVTFLSQRELTKVFGSPSSLPAAPDWRSWIGPLSSLRRGKRTAESALDPVTGEPRQRTDTGRMDCSLAHAAVARVRYPARGEEAASEGWLLYVKPTLVGDEPADVAHYHREHPDFPHESTADQFFDEAQWESYRKLGEQIAMKLFDKRSDRKLSLHAIFSGGVVPKADASVASEPGRAEGLPMKGAAVVDGGNSDGAPQGL